MSRGGVADLPSVSDLRALRRTRRLRATDVAAALSVHPNTILRWERGERLFGLPVSALDAALTTP